ncbi:MAG: hypothetical protein KGK03_07320 [Candidatus Omnitrophica bacterium]|nr:hypothetical protein [Candidatus Omnitrophota bacterium]MDE2222864.1 hypothetical protein [Candidatus Omnitrophota bacterium]
MRKILSILLALMFPWSGSGWAANYNNPIDGVFRAAYGNTVTIDVPSVVGKSPSAADEGGGLTFRLSPSTSYVNFNQLSDLRDGDAVRVYYAQDPARKNSEMLARTITKLSNTTAVKVPETVGITVPSGSSRTTTTSGGNPTVTTTTTSTTTRSGSP